MNFVIFGLCLIAATLSDCKVAPKIRITRSPQSYPGYNQNGFYGRRYHHHNQNTLGNPGFGFPNSPGVQNFGGYRPQQPSGSSAVASASSSGFGRGGSSSAQSESGSINFGPIQATFSKAQANARN